MSSLSHHFLTMAYNNAWANQRLITACSQLSQSDFVAKRTSFFPSIKATLNHNVTVDWYYLDALERSLRGDSANLEFIQFFEPEEPFDTCADLHQAQRETDQRLINVCKALTDTTLEEIVLIPRQRAIYSEQRSRILSHLFQHQIHHRGQVHAMLAGTSVSPPQLDEFFCAHEAPLRAEELKAIGVSETDIWGDE
jgi:uncharacterized damage-inducible protein DinB